MNSSRLRSVFSIPVVAVLAWLVAGSLAAAPLRDVPQTVAQPDGTVLHLLASGDEYYNWMHDEDGHVILRNAATGWLEYAVKVNGRLQPSGLVVGRSDARAAGITPNLRPDPGTLPSPRELFPREEVIRASRAEAANAFTTINNIVIFIRFSDQTEFPDSVSFYEGLHNASGAGAVSEYAYFREASYQKLTIQSRLYPPGVEGYVVSYRDSHPRSYFMPYDAATNPGGYDPNSSTARAQREHTLLASAVNAVAAQIPTSLNVDTNSDGKVDSVVFIVRGEPTAWATLLWPHQWEMGAQYPVNAYINGKLVDKYNFQLEINNRGNKLLVGVLCHEMSHTLGAPDLYHYDNCSSQPDIQPAAKWDLMENDLTPPQHHTAFLKHKYMGWITSTPTISTTGTYQLNPITSATNNVWRVNSPGSTSEYFMLEYRRKTGTFESSLPSSGLLVYRINTDIPATQWGNDCGPPDELYIYRPGGTLTANGQPDHAPLGMDNQRTTMNDSTDPSPFLSDGSPGGLDISEVVESGGTVSFKVTVGGGGGETTVFQDGFEGSFPGQWQFYKDSGKANTEWGRSTYRDNGGSYSVWCAGGGASPQPAGGNYVANMGTWLYYGPFSLAGATDAWAELDLWLDSESGSDLVKWMISVNDNNYYGPTRSGTTNGWEHITFNFKNVSQITALGAPQVWFALIFDSDTAMEGKGAYVDNVVIKKKSGGSTCTYDIAPTSKSVAASGGTGSFNVTTGAGCGWTATSNAAWLQITGGAAGTGSGAVTFSVGANSGTARNGTITAGGKSFTVSQAGVTVVCTNSYWLPVGSHASGANQSQWRTDLSLLNRSASATTADVRLYTTSGMVSRATALAGNAEEILRDAVSWVSSAFTGSGALQVCAGQPLFVTSRTFNLVASSASCTPDGTFGQFYDSISSGGGLGMGQTAWLPGLSENTAFRCNIGLTNTGTSAAAVTVTLHNQSGTQIGSYQVTLNPGQWKQEDKPFRTKAGQTSLDKGYAKVTVTAGSGIIAYASVIDNLTNDPITVPMKQ